MTPRSAEQIRREFIDYFVKKCGHTFVPSSPCVPHDDPTLMFTNAGMNQFKPIFLGQQAPDVDKWSGVIPGMATRAANTQKCIRAGGKHNDLDDVGHDTYHHTFFEMLGNWSFGDYFKKEAIEWAWDLLTKVWGIDPERLHATYFEGDPAEGLAPDSEARDLWLKILPPGRVHPGNKKDNFWEMGDTGPCGPCSEIHIDLTPDKSGAKLVNAGDARVMEVWNLVFIQFNRGSDSKLTPLPARHVDTGMGFERICAVIRGFETGKIGQVSNYDTDVFTPIFAAIQRVTGAPAYTGLLENQIEDLDPSRPSDQSPNRKGGVTSQSSTASDLGESAPAGFFVTFHTYGSWMHGTPRGAVDKTHNQYGAPVLDEVEDREMREFIRLKHRPVTLDETGRRIVDAAIREVCTHRNWTLHELNVRSNHVHIVVSAPDAPERLMNDFKAYATRRLREAGSTAHEAIVWTRHGSTRYLWKAQDIADACDYVRDGQGPDLIAQFETPDDRLRSHSDGASRNSASPNIERSPLPYGRGSDRADRSHAAVMKDVAYRVVADHLRTLTFAITDGAMPSNEGRGYVLRRILRRAVRYGRQYLLGGTGVSPVSKPFLCELVPAVADAMGEAFPELLIAHGGKNVAHLASVIRDEEASFIKTLDRGIALFDDAAEYAGKHHQGRISGEDAFKLHDTYGFPIDLTELMAEERGMSVNIGEYERLMEEAKERARGEKRDLNDPFEPETYEEMEKHGKSCDDSLKYIEPFECSAFIWTLGARQVALNDTDAWRTGSEVRLQVNRTPFYAEQGGQVGDVGLVETQTGKIQITGTYRRELLVDNRIIVGIIHRGKVVRGTVEVGQECRMRVDLSRRRATMHNHTVTHVMNWALRDVLGDHVQQKGSLVDPDKTRFDFSHTAQVSEEQLAQIEELVNSQIEEDLPVFTAEVEQKKAREINTLRAVFGEKYPDVVRVVSIGVPVDQLLADPRNDEWMRYSVEFCGGTHVQRTSEISRFRIVEESAVAKGIRRVIGVTGERAAKAEADARAVARLLKDAAGASDDSLPNRLAEISAIMTQSEMPVIEKTRLRDDMAHLHERAKKAQKEAAKAGAGEVLTQAESLLSDAPRVGDTAIVCGALPGAAVDQLRAACDSLRAKAGSAAVLLATESEGKVVLLAAMTADVVGRGVKAGELIRDIAPVVGGKGGGRPDMAQGGGPEAGKIDEAVSAARQWLTQRIGS